MLMLTLDGKCFDHAADRELGFLPVVATGLAVKSSSTACEKPGWQHCRYLRGSARRDDEGIPVPLSLMAPEPARQFRGERARV
jgi:hypothetical protein